MSSVRFQSVSGHAELSGAERAHLSAICDNLASMALGLRGNFSIRPEDRARIERFVRHGHYSRTESDDIFRWARQIDTAMRVESNLFVWKGASIDVISMRLNTALTLGADAVKLAARLHGQCEIHAYVEGQHRGWLADIIEAALIDGVFRPAIHPGAGAEPWDMGWGGVVAFLRARSDEPVVTSYSVSESFPGPHVIGYADDVDDDEERDAKMDAFFDLPATEQWDRCLAALRADAKRKWLELSPENWESFYFGNGLSILDLVADDADARLDAAFGRES